MSALHGRFGFRRSESTDVNKGIYQRDLQSDFLSAQRRSSGQGRNLGERPPKLARSFDQGRTLQRPLPRLAPLTHGLLDQPRLSVVTSQHLRPVFGNFRELALERFRDASVKR